MPHRTSAGMLSPDFIVVLPCALCRILNDEREVDVRDTIENYETHTAPQAYLLPHERDVQEVPLTPYHKHIVGQDDRFCPAAGVESFSSIWVYYRCIPGFDNSMTAWDILTIWLLVVPSFDKLVESHLELVYQVAVQPFALMFAPHVSCWGCQGV